jgi:hypothetical protein
MVAPALTQVFQAPRSDMAVVAQEEMEHLELHHTAVLLVTTHLHLQAQQE